MNSFAEERTEMETKLYKQGYFTGERALFSTHGARIIDSVFEAGESPLKESSELDIEGCIFGWKYPLWYCKDVKLKGTTLLEGARSGIWYTERIFISDSVIDAPKTFRRSSEIELLNVSMPRAQETLWNCEGITLRGVNAVGDYFALDSRDIYCEDFVISGNYAFDGAKNVTVKNSKLISKDAFWNTENVRVENSLIIGEYLGWNSKNVTFVNCTIQSLQGMCYMKNVKLVNCKLIDTTLAFEYSSVDAEINSRVKSVKNPLPDSVIRAEEIEEIILEGEHTRPEKVKIEVL